MRIEIVDTKQDVTNETSHFLLQKKFMIQRYVTLP